MREDVIILNTIEEAGETPEGVGLDGGQYMRRKQKGVELLRVRVCNSSLNKRMKTAQHVFTYVGREEDLEEGCYEIVDTLHVAASWVPDRPDIENAL